MAIFDYKIGDFLRYLTQTCPSTEVTAIFVYCFSCRYLVERGLRQLGLPVPKARENKLVWRDIIPEKLAGGR